MPRLPCADVCGADERIWRLGPVQARGAVQPKQGIRAVTVPEFVVYLYEAQVLSYRSALAKLDDRAAHTGLRVMQPVREALAQLATRREER